LTLPAAATVAFLGGGERARTEADHRPPPRPARVCVVEPPPHVAPAITPAPPHETGVVSLLERLRTARASDATEGATRSERDLLALVARDPAAAARALLELVRTTRDDAERADALALLADERALSGRPEVAAGLAEIAATAELAVARAGALRTLGQLPAESAERAEKIAAIGRADADPEVRQAAASALADMAERAPGETAARASACLVESLRAETDGSVRATLLGAIRDTRDPTVADAVLSALARDADAQAREAAAGALADVASPYRARAVLALADRFGVESDDGLRRTLLASIVRAGRSSSLGTLESLLPQAGSLATDVNDYLAILRSGEDDPVKVAALKDARENARGRAADGRD
jgi:hypothetical protein